MNLGADMVGDKAGNSFAVRRHETLACVRKTFR
jgi:hypothetical protein